MEVLSSPERQPLRRSASAARAILRGAILTVLIAGCSDSTSAPGTPPILSAISPASAVQGTSLAVTLTGTNFVVHGSTALAISDAGVTVDDITVTSATSATAHVSIAPDAPLGARMLSLTSASGGTSGALTFTILPPPPTITALSDSTLVEGATVTATLTGTHFVPGATTVAVSGNGITATNVSVTSSTTLSVVFTVSAITELGARQVTVTTPGGASAARTITILPPPPTLASIDPAVGITGTTVNVTLTGTAFVAGITTVNISGSGVTVNDVAVPSAMSTMLTTSFVIAPTAELGARKVTVATPGGTTGVVTFTVQAPAPTIGTFTATPETFELGQTVTLAWTGITNATTCSIDQGVGTVPCADGQVTVTPSATTTYRLTATGPGGTITRTLTVGAAAPVIDHFAASPASIITGNPTTLSWDVTNATSCTIDHGIGTVPCTGSSSVSPTTSTTYKLTANGPGGTTTATTTVTVLPPPPTLASLTPSSVAQGSVNTLTLTGTNFVVGVTSVAVSGTGVTISGITVNSATSLTAKFTTSAGATLGARSVTVTTPSGTSGSLTFLVVNGPSITSYTASATVVTAAQPVKLSWATSNATTCSIDNGIGTVSCNGSVTATPGSDKTYTLTASGGGAVVTANLAVSAGAAGRFVYGTAAASNTVAMFTINASTGSLSSIGAPKSTLAQPVGVATDPAGRYAYVADFGANAISMYTIDSVTGALTDNGAVATAIQARRLVVDPSGRFVYAINQGSNDVSMYRIVAGGPLAFIGVVDTDGQPQDIAVDPLGRSVYVTNTGPDEIQVFDIGSNGALTQASTANTSLPSGLTVDPTGRFLYVANRTSSMVSFFSISASGSLTRTDSITVGSSPQALAADPTGRFVVVVSSGTNEVESLVINQTTGQLSAGTTLPTGNRPIDIAIEAGGKFVYVVNQFDNTLSTFQLGPTGALTWVSTAGAGSGPLGVTTSR